MTHLVEADKFFEFISMDNNVQTTNLSETEFLGFNTGEADL